jgi:hypothetical protein
MIIKTKDGGLAVRSRIELLDFLRGVSGRGGLGDSPERVVKATELPLAKVKALLKTTKMKQSA